MFQFILFVQPLLNLCLLRGMAAEQPVGGLEVQVLGLGIMGAWSYALYASGATLVAEKWSGTLDLIMASETHLFKILMASVSAHACVAMIPLFMIIIYSRVFFGIEFPLSHLAAIAPALLFFGFSLAAFGIILAIVFGYLHQVYSYQNLLVHPVLILSGVFYPLSNFPGWMRSLAHILPMSWSIQGLYELLQGKVGAGWLHLTLSLLIDAVYLVLAFWLVSKIEQRLRAHPARGL